MRARGDASSGRAALKRGLAAFACLVASLVSSPWAAGSDYEGFAAERRAPSSPGDDRKPRPDLTYPILYTLTLDAIGFASFNALDDDCTGYSQPSLRNFKQAFSRGPQSDDDAWYWNYAGHPLWGSEVYLRARAQECTPLGSFLFGVTASLVWEFLLESWSQQPSTQDLIITPVAGGLLGELRFQAKRRLLATDTASSRTLAVVVDPLQSVAEWIGRAFGQDWREPAFRHLPVTTCKSRSGPLFTTSLSWNRGRPTLAVNGHVPF
jgi:hypothetical protein